MNNYRIPIKHVFDYKQKAHSKIIKHNLKTWDNFDNEKKCRLTSSIRPIQTKI